jgi:predicted RND superfamily exporter protein
MDIVLRDPQEPIEFRIAMLLTGVGVICALVSFIFNSPLAGSIALLPLTAAFIMAMYHLYFSQRVENNKQEVTTE